MTATDDGADPLKRRDPDRAHPRPSRRSARRQLAIIPGTGHGLFADKPDLVNRIVIDFLTEPRDRGVAL
jgi:pimeloyl-ACP methyl ester carboxylesterase